MDETSVGLGMEKGRHDCRVIADGRRGKRAPEVVTNKSSKHITAVGLTFASGDRGATMVVFEGMGIDIDWIKAAPFGPQSTVETTVVDAAGVSTGL